MAELSSKNKMQPVVNRQQAARMRNARIEQLTQAVLIASKVKSSDPIRKSQLPTVEEEGIGIYSEFAELAWLTSKLKRKA
ncbi:MAG TPA: hypothetical protein DCE56_27780 [Cyanobacteria bacterium UBA8553]|nr:hypothetical protein [Cyanobacteria bacterium UBA8553]